MIVKTRQPHLVEKIIDWIGISKNEISEEDLNHGHHEWQSMMVTVRPCHSHLYNFIFELS